MDHMDSSTSTIAIMPAMASELFTDISESNVITHYMSNTLKEIDPKTKQILKYAIPALEAGRPLNKFMIVLYGRTGSGKSSTINRLFDDDSLYKTSGTKSETKEVSEYVKQLRVTEEDPAIQAFISLVDVPGTLDVDGEDQGSNFAKLDGFRQSGVLQDRKGQYKFRGLSVRGTVYPNLVFFVWSATDKRIYGPDSDLSKSLRSLSVLNMVDQAKPNLVVAVTHARTIPSKKYADRKSEILEIIQQAVRKILKISSVPVNFVENCREDYEDDDFEASDFHRLPDGELSHFNLVQSISTVLQANNDLLGRLLNGWYFHSKCPDKPNKAKVEVSKYQSSNLKEIISKLENTGISIGDLEQVVPLYNFQSLGRSYCPVTESVKLMNLLADDCTCVEVKIQDNKFLVPKYVKVHATNESKFQRLSYENKASYELQKSHQYKLEADVKLVVSVNSQGRWADKKDVSNQEEVLSWTSQVRLASFAIENPEVNVLPSFKAILNQLPNNYNNETAETFNIFFAKYGTHLICKQYIGGQVKLDCVAKTTTSAGSSTEEMTQKLGGMFKIISGNGTYETSGTRSMLQGIGLINESVHISGGDPPGISSLSELTNVIYSDWYKSVAKRPAELENSFELYAFYHLLSGDKSKALRDATLQYLNSTLCALLNKNRDYISKQEVAAVTAVDGSNCFPATARVMTAYGDKQISDLCQFEEVVGSNTVSNMSNNIKLNTTPFYTYLHRDPNILTKFLVLKFQNGQQLTVTGDHLLYYCKSTSNRFQSKMAKFFETGDQMVYIDSQRKSTLTALQSVSETFMEGIYTILTPTGNFVVDGFLVTCYADHGSFRSAHAAFLPLRIWYAFQCKLQKKKGQCAEKCEIQGIHKYGKFLMACRNNIPKALLPKSAMS